MVQDRERNQTQVAALETLRDDDGLLRDERLQLNYTVPYTYCPWPTAAERNLVHAHRNAWSLIVQAQEPMFVLEDDVEFVSTRDLLSRDVQRCDAAAGHCWLLFAGIVDFHFSTLALYITPEGAAKLLAASSHEHPCRMSPADFYTKNACVRRPAWYQPKAEWWAWKLDEQLPCLDPDLRAIPSPWQSEAMFGAGHFVQNRLAVRPSDVGGRRDRRSVAK